ncbi:hypothetical protein BC936DRAFT_147303 [Jimgerdemannia flammicorona]|uniref:Uncharacterized protein n=2 Tax=Jimgerdemannia flammicorona TaxID=994334 RepID=A0A433D5N8_9FUNG|nr:hypothetical protein BC936DRAFT_147303 [Jimgerdemannia flammicorona]RUS31397.1 hypothetical protein BC938DRAFT_477890 [Jimgerdemannia flammicorona]
MPLHSRPRIFEISCSMLLFLFTEINTDPTHATSHTLHSHNVGGRLFLCYLAEDAVVAPSVAIIGDNDIGLRPRYGGGGGV